MQQDIGLIYSLLTSKCIDLSILIDYSTYPRSDQAGVCLIEVFNFRNEPNTGYFNSVRVHLTEVSAEQGFVKREI